MNFCSSLSCARYEYLMLYEVIPILAVHSRSAYIPMGRTIWNILEGGGGGGEGIFSGFALLYINFFALVITNVFSTNERGLNEITSPFFLGKKHRTNAKDLRTDGRRKYVFIDFANSSWKCSHWIMSERLFSLVVRREREHPIDNSKGTVFSNLTLYKPPKLTLTLS